MFRIVDSGPMIDTADTNGRLPTLGIRDLHVYSLEISMLFISGVLISESSGADSATVVDHEADGDPLPGVSWAIAGDRSTHLVFRRYMRWWTRLI